MLINENQMTNSNIISSVVKAASYLFMLSIFSVVLQIVFNICNASAAIIDISKYSISNGFFVTDKEIKFEETVRGETCRGVIHYPYMTNEAEDIFIEINDEIHDFAEIYSVCNETPNDNYSVSYSIPESHKKDFFSVIWHTKKDKELWRIDTLVFDRDQGDLATINQIFNPLAQLMFGEMVELSEGHLSKDMRWSDFLIAIERRDIQIYVERGVWMIAFNPTPKLDKLVYKKLPDYFLIGDDVTSAR